MPRVPARIPEWRNTRGSGNGCSRRSSTANCRHRSKRSTARRRDRGSETRTTSGGRSARGTKTSPPPPHPRSPRRIRFLRGDQRCTAFPNHCPGAPPLYGCTHAQSIRPMSAIPGDVEKLRRQRGRHSCASTSKTGHRHQGLRDVEPTGAQVGVDEEVGAALPARKTNDEVRDGIPPTSSTLLIVRHFIHCSVCNMHFSLSGILTSGYPDGPGERRFRVQPLHMK